MLDRQHVLDGLDGALWPLIDAHSCRLCAQPRPERYAGFAECYRCARLGGELDRPIDRIDPITYTSPDWMLGRALRRFKDEDRCAAASDRAAGFAAILSSFLEAYLPETPRGRYDTITIVPTTAPVIERSLQRARSEGWWVPEITPVARIARGQPRQRDRHSSQRHDVPAAKWVIDHEALGKAADVLLLDDMMTTGGSLFSFAAALRRSGVAAVDVVVVARNLGANASWVRPLLETVAARQPWSPGLRRRIAPLH